MNSLSFLTRQDRLFILFVAIIMLAANIIGWMIFGEFVVLLAIVLSTVCLLVVALEIYRRHNMYLSGAAKALQAFVVAQNNNVLRQIEALLSIYNAVQPLLPLPHTRGSAASPDLLMKIIEIILSKKPRLVVELGSGTSTVIIAYCLKKAGAGQLVSLDHDPYYAKQCQKQISGHALGDIATVILAPLKDVEIGGQVWQWYDIDGLEFKTPIDLLIIDGPPATIQHMARYPALPLLLSRLSSEAIIIMDDGMREDEQKIVNRWKEEVANLVCMRHDMEKGAFVIQISN